MKFVARLDQTKIRMPLAKVRATRTILIKRMELLSRVYARDTGTVEGPICSRQGRVIYAGTRTFDIGWGA